MSTPNQQRLPAARPLQDHEDPAGPGIRRPLGIQVGSHRGEEPARHRNQPLPSCFSLGDEHPPLSHTQVRQATAEDLAAAQPAQHHRRDHGRSRCVRRTAVSAFTSAGDKIRGSWRVARTSGTP